MIRAVLFAGAAVSAVAASATWASDAPSYAPAPAWVVPAAPVDPAKLGDDAPMFLVNDTQDRFADGQVWTYRETATRVVSDDALARLGTINLTWYPDHGDLVIHGVTIVRGGERIDAIKAGSKFTVLRREAQLEQFQLNGMLTATMAVEGLRVGDVLDIAYSTTNRDPALKGNVQAGAPIVIAPFKIGYTRTRLLWPNGTDLKWRAYPAGATAVPSDKGGWHELVFTGAAPKQPELPKDAPLRFQKLPAVEATTFTGWTDVSKTMSPLFKTDGLIAPGSPLDGEVQTIMKAESDPLKRTALALALVQDKVRYLYKGLEGGNYVPQTPTQTWAVRYGDCKAKTLLLLSILRALKIDAEPVLANLGAGDLVSERLPSAAAFNHVLVHAKVGGEDLWLDGTGRGTHLDDIRDTPALRWVLPLRPEGTGLLPVALRPQSRADTITIVDIDESAGIDLPAPFTASVTVRGAMADVLRTIAAQGTKEDRLKMAGAMAGGVVGPSFVATHNITFDAAAGTATLSVKGVTFQDWTHEEQRYRASLDRTLAKREFDPDRSRPAWKDIPVATGNPGYIVRTARITLPNGGTGFTLDGDQSLDETIAGARIQRKTTLAGGVVTIDERVQNSGAEIAPAAVAGERAKLAAAQRRQLRASTAVGYPAPWAGIEAAKRAHKFDTSLGYYAQAIADKPDEAGPYLSRASFYAGIFDRKAALADYDKAIGIAATPEAYLRRAAIYQQLDDKAKAMADAKAAYDLQPGSIHALSRYAWLQADAGQKDAAVALVQERIDDGGKDKAAYLNAKADILARAGDKDGALAAIDSANEISPGNAGYLNSRCWLKGTLNTALDTALKDCTRAIELGTESAPALDSRAMVYFRMKRFDDALADLNAALDLSPGSAGSLYMRGVIHRRMGDKAGDADLAGARLLSPEIDKDYARYGIAP